MMLVSNKAVDPEIAELIDSLIGQLNQLHERIREIEAEGRGEVIPARSAQVTMEPEILHEIGDDTPRERTVLVEVTTASGRINRWRVPSVVLHA